MKLETFFEKFDQFTEAPDAVERMRELVLDLAVQGRVVDQDSNDEPAVKLLQRLIAFKLANPLSGRSGRSKEDPMEVEASSDGLPANWVNTTIGEVLYVIRGASPRPKGDPQYFSETRTPYHWVKISDIRKHGQNGLLLDTDEFLTEAGMRKSVLLPKGTLVLTNSATIGVPIVLGIEGCCIHDGYLAFPKFPHDLLSQKFLLYLFHTLKKHAERNARGLAQLNLNTDLVRSFPFGLPPLAEQKRIVAKVDALMALCDRLEAQQQERETRHAALARASLARFADAPIPANLPFLFHPSYAIPPADLRKSILTLAVQGKLVPQDPNDEPAEAPDERQRAERNAEGIPDSWALSSLDEVAEEIVDCPHSTPKWTSSGKICVRTNQFRPGRLDLSETKFVSEDTFEDRIQRLRPREDDILYSREGGILGIACRVPLKVELCLGQRMMLIRAGSSLAPTYLELVLNAPLITEIARRQTTGGAAPRVNVSTVKSYPIPIPPLAEQRRIVAKVEQLMALVDELETEIAASRATAANLLAALIAELTTA